MCLLLDRSLFATGEAEALATFTWAPGGERLFITYLRQLLAKLDGAPLSAAAGVERSAVAMLRACKTGSRDAIDEAKDHLRDAAMARARLYVVAHLTKGRLGPAEIAAAAGVSRATLYRLFRSRGGVATFVQQERLASALKRMTDPVDRRSIAEISYDCGFVDAAHFSRSFLSRYGFRPSDLRPLR